MSSSFHFVKPETWPYMPLYEKIQYYATVLDEKYGPFVDKLSVKQIVRSICPELQTAVLIRILSDSDDLSESDFNHNHLLKATHGCGWNVRLDGSTSISAIRENLRKWSTSYSSTEKQYTNIKPAFFIEEIIDDKYTDRSGLARVFMFRCIWGNPVSVGVRVGLGNNKQNSYTPNFELMGRHAFLMEKPSQWNTMLEMSRALSARFEFVRVDFYIGSDEQIYFSEFTFTPAGGNRVFSMKVEHELGRLW